jgi:hypothetical protein
VLPNAFHDLAAGLRLISQRLARFRPRTPWRFSDRYPVAALILDVMQQRRNPTDAAHRLLDGRFVGLVAMKTARTYAGRTWPDVERALRERADRDGTTLNQVWRAAIQNGVVIALLDSPALRRYRLAEAERRLKIAAINAALGEVVPGWQQLRREREQWHRLKKQGRAIRFESLDPTIDLVDPAGFEDEIAITLEQLDQLSRLSDRDRLLLTMQAAGFHAPELAHRFNTTPGTIRFWLSQARKRLGSP